MSILLETCKRALLLDFVVNLLACAKPQEWQVSLKRFQIYLNIDTQNLPHYTCYFFHVLVYNSKSFVLQAIIGLCFGACSSAYICASGSSGASFESQVP